MIQYIESGKNFQTSRVQQNLQMLYGVTGGQSVLAKVDPIQKGEITERLVDGYGSGSEPLKFEKTGKELKEKFPSVLASLNAEKAVLEAQMSALKESIKFDPTRTSYRRLSKASAAMLYEWSCCEPEYLGNNIYADKTPEMDLCNSYNQYARALNEIQDDIDTVEVLAANLQDNKKYSLSVSQLVSINFK